MLVNVSVNAVVSDTHSVSDLTKVPKSESIQVDGTSNPVSAGIVITSFESADKSLSG